MANLSSTRIFGDASVERSLYVKKRLGVGVGNPSERIEVGGESYPQIRFDTSDGNSTVWDVGFAGDYAFQIRNQNTSDTHVTVNPGGNVGINENSPSYKLDVNGDTNIQGTLRNNGSDVYARTDQFERITSRWEWDTNDANTAEVTWDKPHSVSGTGLIFDFDRRGGTKHQLRMTNGDHLQFRETNNNNTNLYLERGSGNVGIGTTSPSQELDVSGQVEAQDYYIREDNLWLGDHVSNDDAHHPDHRDGIDYIDFNNKEQSDYNTDGRLYWDLSAGLYIKSSNANTNSPEVLWSRANVGAGSNISISYDSEGEPTISASGGNTYTDSDAIDAIESNSNKLNMSAGIDIQSNGNIDSVNKLNVSTIDSNNGNGHIDWKQPVHFNGNGGNNESYEVRISGKGLRVDDSVRATGDVIAFYSSDRRLKNDPTQIQNPLSEISKLTGVGFGWKEKASREGKGFGVFAHDAKSIDERLVRKQGDGYLGVDYQQLHGIEIEALKQVNEKVEENQSEIQRLKQRIAKLESNDNAI